MLRVVMPAPPSAVLEVAPPFARLRGRLLAQGRASETAAIFDGDELLVVAMIMAVDAERELCLGFSSRARARMRELVRLCHSTMLAYADNGVTVMVSVLPENRQGRRMAHLAGFVADPDHPRKMVFRGSGHVDLRKFERVGGRGEKPEAATDQQ
ncbi:hypothetical protein [Pleomorphomonas koreensis]|uniref:hypothetical protein n=1 Tax=Pleomorphomonas koreensis TaxID=257440 RepID=UPI0003F97FD7|nr:hypothetical protein [Pleomorphomonas koreensis]